MGIEQKAGNLGIVTVTLEQAVNWSRTNSMWPMLFGSGLLRDRDDGFTGCKL